MKYFRFYSYGIAPQSRKNYLNPSCKNLKNIFTMTDIKPGMFSPSVTKRLTAAKVHGTKIVLRTWRNAVVGVIVVDRDAHKLFMNKRALKIKALKKKLKSLSPPNDVNEYLEHLHQLCKLMGDHHLQSACTNLLAAKKRWKI